MHYRVDSEKMNAQLSREFLLPPPEDAQCGAGKVRKAHHETSLDASTVAVSDDGAKGRREILDKVKAQRDAFGYPISLVGFK